MFTKILTLGDLGKKFEDYEVMLPPSKCNCGCGKYKTVSWELKKGVKKEEAVGQLMFHAIEYCADLYDACKSYAIALLKDGTVITTFLPDKDHVVIETYSDTAENNIKKVEEDLIGRDIVSLMVIQELQTIEHNGEGIMDFRVVAHHIYEYKK